MANDLMSSIEKKSQVTVRELVHTAWESAIVSFKETHCVGHGLWQFVDPKHQEFDGHRIFRLGDPVGRIYRALARNNSQIAFNSRHRDGSRGVFKLLHGAQRQRASSPGRDLQTLGSSHVKTLQSPARSWSSGATRHSWSSGLSLLLQCGSQRQSIALKLSCRDPGQFSAMLEDTSALRAELRDADTGLPVLDWINQPSTLRRGTAASRLPDIVAWCRPNATPRAVVSPDLGRIEGSAQRVRPGNHSMGGAVFSAGARASALSSQLKNVSDFAEFTLTFFKSTTDSRYGFRFEMQPDIWFLDPPHLQWLNIQSL